MRKTTRNKSGVAIVEGAASMAVMLPIMFLCIYVALEVSYMYVLKATLAEGAREAARNLAIAYGRDPDIAGDRSSQDSEVFDRVRIANVINDSAQFNDPVFNANAEPPTVTVTVRYTDNQFGLPPFPNPDPLHVSGLLTLVGTSTYRLQ
ncbi:MAG: pilus assembly protein [Candidatus Obscuribacterales bacterium]|nr:pilus assembly protein [Candidatus Obscuribacterales bacterium]